MTPLKFISIEHGDGSREHRWKCPQCGAQNSATYGDGLEPVLEPAGACIECGFDPIGPPQTEQNKGKGKGSGLAANGKPESSPPVSLKLADLRRANRRQDASPIIDLSKIDRLPPHSIESEQGVLGCILLDPTAVLGECVLKLKAGHQYFYDLRHQTIYDQTVEMYEAKQGIDMVTLSQRLKDKNQLESVGGLPYLTALPDAVASAANLPHYLEIVLDKFALRKAIASCTQFVGRAYEHQGEMDELLDELEVEVMKITSARIAGPEMRTMQELMRATAARVQMFHEHRGDPTGMLTGFKDLDQLTCGLKGGEMIVIAARPSMGKTSLAMNIAEHVAVTGRLPVGIFSLEMSADSLSLRLLCSHARVSSHDVQRGLLSERDITRLTMAGATLSSAPLFIDDSAGLSILQLRAKARRMVETNGVKLIIVDYLQLLHSTNRKADNRQQEVADISSGLKAMGKELNVPVIVLAQLNREVERRDSGKPRLSDLRESGSLEQDADIVGLLYRQKKGSAVEESEDECSDASIVDLLIAKSRNGPTGEVPLTFLRNLTRFEGCTTKPSEEELPRV